MSPEKQEATGSPVSGAGAWPWTAFDVATVATEAVAWEINRRGEEIMRLRAALTELLNVAERIRGGDTKLDTEQWYATRDYARHVLRGGADG